MYFINIKITQHVLQSAVENENPMLCCCVTWIVFIELNFTFAFLLIRKTWDDQFAGKVGKWGDFKKWGGDPRNGEDDFKMGGG